MTTQIALRLDDAMVGELDRLVVSNEDLENRSEAIRVALTEFIQRRNREMIDAEIVAGYQRLPQTPENDIDEWGDLAASVRSAPLRD
jgi:Arc/MetJ-type ribon-helix-helix transcriptional regulator